METKKIGLIVMALLSLSGALPATATDNDGPPAVGAPFPPLAPTNLVAQPGDGVATLRWDHPDNTPVDAWQYRQDTGDWQDMPDDADRNEYTVRHLTGGATYRFAVRAHSAAGWGPASNTAVVTLNAAPRITGLERASFAENGQGVVATYSARDGESHAMEWSLSGRDAEAFTFATDLDDHTMDLLFRSVPDYERPSDVPPTDNDYQVTVVATDHGRPALATHYPVRVQVVNVDENGPVPAMAESERSRHTTQAEQVGWVVRSVVNYYKDVVGWALRGVINHVRDVWNASKRAQSDANAPVSARVPAAPEVSVHSGAWSAAMAAGRVNVSVFKPSSNGSALTAYEYQLYQGEDRLLDWTSAGVDATTLAALAPGAVSSFSVGRLLQGQPYAVVVRAVNGAGASGSVWAMATPGRMLAPERLQAVAGDRLVALTWSAAATEGPVITRYEWRGRPIWGAWSAWTPVAGNASARGHTVDGLENGVEYTFEVRAANPAGAGPVAPVAARPRASVPIQVSYGSAIYQAVEGGAGVAVLVRLSRVADQALTIPITVSVDAGTEEEDYAVPGLVDGTRWLLFPQGSSAQSFAVMARDDVDTDDEMVRLWFGALPSGVTVGAPAQAVVMLIDDDGDPDERVSLSPTELGSDHL